MSVVIKIISLADGAVTEHDGRYVSEWGVNNPDHPYAPTLSTVADPTLALVFADARAALEAWRETSKLQPRRPDRKPNRPLTSFTIGVLTLDEAMKEGAP